MAGPSQSITGNRAGEAGRGAENAGWEQAAHSTAADRPKQDLPAKQPSLLCPMLAATRCNACLVPMESSYLSFKT